MTGRLGRILDHDLAEVLLGPQRGGGDPPYLEKMSEIAELVERRELPGRVGWQGHPVAPGDLQQRLGPDGAFQVNMQLDLRERHDMIITSRSTHSAAAGPQPQERHIASRWHRDRAPPPPRPPTAQPPPARTMTRPWARPGKGPPRRAGDTGAADHPDPGNSAADARRS